jgi:hypothetical protein
MQALIPETNFDGNILTISGKLAAIVLDSIFWFWGVHSLYRFDLGKRNCIDQRFFILFQQ